MRRGIRRGNLVVVDSEPVKFTVPDLEVRCRIPQDDLSIQLAARNLVMAGAARELAVDINSSSLRTRADGNQDGMIGAKNLVHLELDKPWTGSVYGPLAIDQQCVLPLPKKDGSGIVIGRKCKEIAGVVSGGYRPKVNFDGARIASRLRGSSFQLSVAVNHSTVLEADSARVGQPRHAVRRIRIERPERGIHQHQRSDDAENDERFSFRHSGSSRH